MSKKILVVPDVHFPFADFKALRKMYVWAKHLKPDIYVCVGDAFDLYSMSRFPRSYNIMTPKQEIDTARKNCEEMWHELLKASPRAKAFHLKGNHEDRIQKKVREKVPELESLINVDPLFTFNRVELVTDDLIIKINGEKVLFEHGYFTKQGDHVKRNQMSTVHGHTHRPDIYYHALEGKTLFELDCGYLGNQNHPALSYTPKRTSNWSKAFGFIDYMGPRIKIL